MAATTIPCDFVLILDTMVISKKAEMLVKLVHTTVQIPAEGMLDAAVFGRAVGIVRVGRILQETWSVG